MKEQVPTPAIGANRREFLQGVGGLTLVISSTGLITACSTDEAERLARSEGTDLTANIWVTIGTDDTVTIQYPATEMGQGTSTALPLILADELDADWD
ncbi:MAG: molybdopterin-dependent oxidoreductase, partial [Gammaproteobacteria bacterium]|nr:molybdopterin-dependent oxidoreductase [Gammaproteobacteria bacterium]